MDTRTTRLPLDLLKAAESEAHAEHRSTAKQVEHWARIGMYFDGLTSLSRRRIQRAVAGDLPLAKLSADEAVAANATINASISATANGMSFVERLAARGVTTVILDADGNMVRRYPDGSVAPL